MAVETVKVADRMDVIYNAVNSGGTVKGYLDGQATQHVSMAGASRVSATGELLKTVAGDATEDGVEMILEESNDRMNWFIPDNGQKTLTDTATGRRQTIDVEISMAYVRVLFLIRSSQNLAPGDGAVVDCTLTTSL